VSIPIIFASISETVIHVTDTMFLARVGTVEVGALALADTILEIWIVLTVGLVDGLQVLLARRVGQGRDEAVGEVFNLGLALLTVVSVALTASLLIATPFLTAWLVRSAPVGAAVDVFLDVMSFSILFNSMNLAYSALLVGLERTRVLIGATVVLAVTNIGLDYVLVFGKLGFPAMGMRGSALGSLGAEIATFLFLTIYVMRRLEIRRYGMFRIPRWNMKLGRLLGGISSPVALQALLEGLKWFTFFLLLEWVSGDALAASNIVYSCFALLLIPTEGFAETTCSMVSKLIGEGKAERIGHLMREVISPAYMVTLPFMAIGFFFPDFVLSLVTSDPEMIAASRASLRVVSLGMLVVIPAEIWFVAVTGTGDTRATFAIEIVLTVATLAVSYVSALVLGLGLEYVWMSVPLASLACLALSYGWVRVGYWKRLEI
jgi:putative MATE family efflux protein